MCYQIFEARTTCVANFWLTTPLALSTRKEVQSGHEKQQEHAADQKLATFLFTLSARYKERGYSDTRFNLMMPRRDIANHLNLAPETISRLFKRFQRDGLIDVKRTDLQILDLPALGVLGGCNQMCV
ncbi:hypothetical protein A3715_05215 [Oleiphilus sp. HI0009]|uniref:helix-turn-helix domain-containing protein n=1 Tax=Oleiphilus sp. HI0125 TaxID=1822266 RepID=UPI0007C27F4D|nr:helix-turn-helix domain-containing protein [Oleiphilus sp. HI0125]KZX76468.1 hypothetical protein A3715_21875 [Oleiphilus sp. HI0009]KZX83166.1 hypothetical protein A3715_05215 [Oleiphilus sp. HI0009]KZZ56299.1 hypothetical protein A3762_20870 [Oleiphilus sp. HI0125]KZZ59019.1 hypothetical protein A3762_06300 [Oleiphilus sp. HI0125]